MLLKRSHQPPDGAPVPDTQENHAGTPAGDAGERYSSAGVHYPRDLAIFLKEKKGLRRVFITDILLVAADGNYVELHTPHGRVVLRNSMCEVLRSMPNAIFSMVNRSQAVNILMVDHIGADEVTIGRRSFTLTRRYREDLLRKMNIVASR
jgi:DNA-binding LytR/AlgR family response regulator